MVTTQESTYAVEGHSVKGMYLNSFLASGNFCHLLITIVNRLDPDQDRQNVGPDLDLNCLTL